MDQEPKASIRVVTRWAALNRRLRQAFLEGAEERSMRVLGRGLTADELRRVLRRYPGDIAER